MALYVENTGLESLLDAGKVDRKRMLELLGRSRRIPAIGGDYYSCLLASGLEIVFRAPSGGQELEITGVDMHMAGRCLWKAVPIVQVGHPEPLALTLLLSDVSNTHAFVADIAHAATRDDIDTEHPLELQVCAFPVAMDVYSDRAAYEQATDSDSRLVDRAILPYNYLLARDERYDERTRSGYREGERRTLVSGPILSVIRRDHGLDDSWCEVATMATAMGHLDLVCGPRQNHPPLHKGSYVVAECHISGDVLVVENP